MEGSTTRVLLLDTKPNNVNYYIVLGIAEALKNHAKVSSVKVTNYENLISDARTGQYDLCIAVDGEEIVLDVLRKARPYLKCMALWTFDDPYERYRTVPISPLFDLVYTNDTGSVQSYGPGAKHLALGASPTQHFRDIITNDAEYKYDVSFIGSAWPNRVRFLRGLMQRLPDLKTRIVLAYNPHLPKCYLDLPSSSYIGGVSQRDFVDIYRKSRVTLTLHRDFAGGPKDLSAKTPGPRLFETALAGGFQLIDANETPVEAYYSPGKEVDVFKDLDHCVDLIKTYLSDPDTRISMVQNAQDRTKTEHLYANRIDTILQDFSALRKPENTIRINTSVDIEKNSKPRLLFVTHNMLSAGNFGGVEVYQETVANILSDKYDIFYFAPKAGQSANLITDYILTDHRQNVLDEFSVPSYNAFEALHNEQTERVFSGILTQNKIDLVHFQHLIKFPLSLPLISKMLGVPSAFTTHDYYLVCSRFNLLDVDNKFCGMPERDKRACDVCLKAGNNYPYGSQSYRQNFIRYVLDSVDKVIANSDAALHTIGGIYPDVLPPEKIHRLGIPIPKLEGQVHLTRSKKLVETICDTSIKEDKPPLNVVFLGNFTHIKGAETFLRTIEALRDHNINFTICGRIDEHYQHVLSEMNCPNVTVMGQFNPGELDLTEYDVALMLAIWPETYAITLSEAWAAKVVPIVTDIGALGERTHHGINGIKIPVNGVGELLSNLEALISDRRYLNQLKNNINADLWCDADDHVAHLNKIYTSLLDETDNGHASLNVPQSLNKPADLKLTDIYINSPYWSEPNRVYGTQMPDPDAPDINPLRKTLELFKAYNNSAGFIPDVPVQIHLDRVAVDNAVIENGSLPHKLVRKSDNFEIAGWLRFKSAFVYKSIFLKAQSAKGDLILAPIVTFPRDDVSAKFSDSVCVGFGVEQFSLQMLYDPLYTIELLFDTGSSWATASLDLIIGQNKKNFILANLPNAKDSDHQLHLPRKLDQKISANQETSISFVNDGVSISGTKTLGLPHDIETSGLAKNNSLFVRGWFHQIGCDESFADLDRCFLLFNGPTQYVSALSNTYRSDLAEYYESTGSKNIAVNGEISLQGVVPGIYELTILSCSNGSYYNLAHLDAPLLINPDGTAQIQERYIENSSQNCCDDINVLSVSEQSLQPTSE